MTDLNSLTRAVRFVRSQGAKHIALCYWDKLPFAVKLRMQLSDWGVTAVIQADGRASTFEQKRKSVVVLTPEQACGFEPLDAIIVVDQSQFAWILRCIENVLQRDVLVIPANKDWIVPESLPKLTLQEALQESIPVEYVARSGLSGHYLEFGTYWGRSFFPAYFRFRHSLKGSFYAFDSFAGLSEPMKEETMYTGGDFQHHTYNFGLRSFQSIAKLLDVDAARLKVVSGYYAQTLTNHEPTEYGLEPGSVSVCVIDCDLYEPTSQVLDFITPLLQPGSLLYFDDWRLCRASPKVGERAAALAWLKAHPEIELTELHRSHWQNQWFIFNNNAG